jgi:hypothetical protein
MTTSNPTSGNTPAFPTLSDTHLDTLQLRELIQALDALQDLGGAKSGPIWAIVQCALPLARKISSDIERANNGK